MLKAHLKEECETHVALPATGGNDPKRPGLLCHLHPIYKGCASLLPPLMGKKDFFTQKGTHFTNRQKDSCLQGAVVSEVQESLPSDNPPGPIISLNQMKSHRERLVLLFGAPLRLSYKDPGQTILPIAPGTLELQREAAQGFLPEIQFGWK